MSELDARGLTYDVPGRRILDGVDVLARSGELVGVVGPNGSGKTTLLSVLAGDLRPSAGDVAVDGRPVRAWSSRELARRRAVLPQHTVVSFPFTVRSVVGMGVLRISRDGTDPAAVADDAMTVAGVDHLADRPVTELSGGEQARVALARVLAQRTGIVMLDEPTASLDVHHQHVVMSVSRRLADDGRLVIAVLHDLPLASTYCDRVIVLSAGRVRATGAPADVLTAETLTDVFGHPMDVRDDSGHAVIVARRINRARLPATLLAGGG